MRGQTLGAFLLGFMVALVVTSISRIADWEALGWMGVGLILAAVVGFGLSALDR